MTQPNQHTPTTPLAFVIPVVHPGGHRVSNYDVVEKSLRLTLTSLTQSSLAHAPIFIVCHKRPDWHAEFAPTVTFLVIPEHPWFTDDVKDRFSAVEGDPRGVRIDKGLKFLAGMAYARQACDPRFLMPMDADDFVRKDIIKHITEHAESNTESDCYLVSRGFHVPLRNTDYGFELQAAFELDRFDETCGTSRIFHSERFFDFVKKHGPEILKFDADDITDGEHLFKTDFLDCLGQMADRDIDNDNSFVRIVGSHTTQDVFFAVSYIDAPLAGKACGHGNHVGWQHGGIHWHKFYAVASSKKFMDDFGIGNTPLLRRSLGLRTKFRGWRCVLGNRKNQTADLA